MKKFLAISAVSASFVVPLFGAGAASAADAYKNPHTYDQAMVSFAMKAHHLNQGQAKKFVADQAAQQAKLDALTKAGVATDGAYFDADNQLVVIANDTNGAKVAAHGLKHKKGKGQSQLNAAAAKVTAKYKGKSAVAAVATDITTGKVAVTVTKDASPAVVADIKKLAGTDVSITVSAPNETQADVLGGQDMNMPLGDGRLATCSNGFMATLGNGNTVMLTAGHCVEKTQLPVQDAAGNHVGVILDGLFHTGSASRDIGLVDIDSDDTPYGYVDTRGADGYYGVRGMSKAAVGSQLCKSGRTTGWTCGTVKSYGTNVNYGNGTSVSDLMTTTVCTEPGDSGGAYIGAGNLAQGMTSGGPVGQKCGGFNQGWNTQAISYVQPVVDAAQYYGATIMTSN